MLFERGGRVELGGGRRAATPGRMALVELGQGPGRARVVRELGDPSVAADVIEAMLADRDVRVGFDRRIEGEAADAAASAAGLDFDRRDLRELLTFTVDPASAHDFDDAVSASRTERGYRLWIHIADVAAHIRPGGALETEAFRRANSTYVPGRVAPMLPQILSSDSCSLVPDEDRLAVTSEIEISEVGEPLSASFYRSLIRSDTRLNYEELDEIFSGRARPPERIGEPLALAREAAAALAGRRPRSSLEVESFEPEFRFEDGQVIGAHSVQQTEAHRLIEHLMVLTNERVAELLERRRIPTLYRVHEQPDPERIRWLIAQLAALDIPTPPLPDTLSPQQAGELAGEASRVVAREAERRGHGREAYTSLVLRSLKQAHYYDRNLGHAGLGSPAYCHFTSPIRRYPDLVAHRGLLSAIGAGEEAPRADGLAEAGAHCSERERDATRLERDADSVCACFLLERELFERGSDTRFEGEVSGVVGAGAFVRFGGSLADVYEGFLPARRIGGRERYELDVTETMLVGSRGGDAIRIGDPVRVTVDRVEAPRGRVDLLPSDDARAPRQGRPA
ncbi:MAG TPA: RNB domain-containing ribonuclease [Solirubrobacterales bacterium]|nr:RNB domain-containing ribonuclease [Solirubrobacterales bacterium]